MSESSAHRDSCQISAKFSPRALGPWNVSAKLQSHLGHAGRGERHQNGHAWEGCSMQVIDYISTQSAAPDGRSHAAPRGVLFREVPWPHTCLYAGKKPEVINCLLALHRAIRKGGHMIRGLFISVNDAIQFVGHPLRWSPGTAEQGSHTGRHPAGCGTDTANSIGGRWFPDADHTRGACISSAAHPRTVRFVLRIREPMCRSLQKFPAKVTDDKLIPQTSRLPRRPPTSLHSVITSFWGSSRLRRTCICCAREMSCALWKFRVDENGNRDLC